MTLARKFHSFTKCQCLYEKNVFYMEGGEGVCAERDVTQEGSHEET